MKKIQPTRRNFLKTTLAAGVAPTILPSGLFGADAPSKKITVGCIGVGGHGTGHNLRAYLKQADARVVMVCDVDAKRMERAKKMARGGNTGRMYRGCLPIETEKKRTGTAAQTASQTFTG